MKCSSRARAVYSLIECDDDAVAGIEGLHEHGRDPAVEVRRVLSTIPDHYFVESADEIFVRLRPVDAADGKRSAAPVASARIHLIDFTHGCHPVLSGLRLCPALTLSGGIARGYVLAVYIDPYSPHGKIARISVRFIRVERCRHMGPLIERDCHAAVCPPQAVADFAVPFVRRSAVGHIGDESGSVLAAGRLELQGITATPVVVFRYDVSIKSIRRIARRIDPSLESHVVFHFGYFRGVAGVPFVGRIPYGIFRTDLHRIIVYLYCSTDLS